MAKPAVQIQTLFFDAATRSAVLVTNRNGKRHRRALRFRDPHAALNWCIKQSAGFVFVPATGSLN
jgi:hypothetical protein